MVSSGSIALLLSMLALGIGEDDEVIVPNYCWVSAAHAPALLGAKVVPVDTFPNVPLLDINQIERNITSKTKAIIPVHLNGRACDMKAINSIARAYNLFVVEDSAQSFLSCNDQSQKLGTLSDIGCFSLSMCKLVSSGQGGFCVTKDADLASKLREMRTHGLSSTFSATKWSQLGFNFRYNDILASIALSQIQNVDDYIHAHRSVDSFYRNNISNPQFIPFESVNSSFNIPIYQEYFVDDQSSWIDYLKSCGIQARPFYPCLHTAEYLYDSINTLSFPYSSNFSSRAISLPGGPHISLSHLQYVVDAINSR
jgi:dTDP-4-amino-4,6-dideoxygalactose transaminase